MRKLYQATLFIVLNLLSFLTIAAVEPNIRGITRDGTREISVNVEGGPIVITLAQPLGNEKYKFETFNNEPCEHFYNADNTKTFLCSSNAKSPFAGSKWIGKHPKTGRCEEGFKDYYFECISGCKKNNNFPRDLTQDHYEC